MPFSPADSYWERNSRPPLVLRPNHLPAVVVSIHDVHFGTMEDISCILRDLQKRDVSRVSLLTVPDYHQKGRLDTQPHFCRWLREQSDSGHEIVLHGYFHLRQPKRNDRLPDRAITQFYTAKEGEFYDLAYSEARQRLELGREIFGAAGVDPQGFIAPAWLLGREAENAVRKLDFRYTVRLATVTDFSTGITYPARTLVYSTRTAWRRVASLAWNPLINRWASKDPLLRLSIHPPDWKFPALRAQILWLLTNILTVRRPLTYYDWVSQGGW